MTAAKLHSRKTSQLHVVIGLLVFLSAADPLRGADYPAPEAGEFVLHGFRFHSGGSLPDLRMHYRTLGAPRRDENGIVRNAVLILHGTTGSSAQFLRDEFADELFGPGKLLDAARYYLI